MKNKDHEIYLTYSESEEGGVPDDPNERWTSHSPLYIDFHPQKLYSQKQSWQETIKVSWDPSQFLNKSIWIVVTRYQSGSTFGTSHGNWDIVEAYTTANEAQIVSEIIAKYSKDED